MATTYDPIASTTLTSSASSVTFSSLDTIAAGYRDLIVIAEASATTNAQPRMQVNGDTGSNYSVVWAEYGASSGTSTTTHWIFNATNHISATAKPLWQFNFMDFAATDKHKSVLQRTSVSNSTVSMAAMRWASTSAITSISFILNTGQYASGSTFAIYGVAA